MAGKNACGKWQEQTGPLIQGQHSFYTESGLSILLYKIWLFRVCMIPVNLQKWFTIKSWVWHAASQVSY